MFLAGPSLAGADRVVFFWKQSLWSITTDGHDLRRHADEPGQHLTWLDIFHVAYTAGNCVRMVNVLNNEVQNLLCLDQASMEQFALSPNGKWAAMLSNESLYIFPYQPETWPEKPVRPEVFAQQVGACIYRPQPVTLFRWGYATAEGERILVRLRTYWRGQAGHLVVALTFSQCPGKLAQRRVFPLVPETIPGFYQFPFVLDMDWNGVYAFLISPLVRPEDWGQLYGVLQNTTVRLNPVQNQCCYRLPRMAPDGRALFVIYGPAEEPARLGIWRLSAWDSPQEGWTFQDFWPSDQIPLNEVTDWAWRPAP